MPVIDELKILVTAEVAKAVADLDKTQKAATKTGASFKDMAAFMMGPVAAGKQVIAIFQQVKAVADKMEAEFAVAEEAAALLNSTLKATGNAAGLTAEEIQDLAQSFQDTTKYEADVVLGMENVLLGFKNIKGDNFKEASLQILNMATVMKMDLTSAAQAVGKALDDPIRGIDSLSRQGFKFSDEQKAMLKSLVETGQIAKAQGIILDELATTYGGAAEAAGDTATAVKVKLGNAIGDINEEIGRSIANNLKPWREKWLDLAQAIGASAKAQNDFRDAMEKDKEGKATDKDRLVIAENYLAKLKEMKTETEDLAFTYGGAASSDAKHIDEQIKAQEQLVLNLKKEIAMRDGLRTAAQKAAAEAEAAREAEKQRNQAALDLYHEALKSIKDIEREEQARQDILGETIDYQELSNTAYEQARRLISESNGLITEANPLYKNLIQLALDWAKSAQGVKVEIEDIGDQIKTEIDGATESSWSFADAWGDISIEISDEMKDAFSSIYSSASDTFGAISDLQSNQSDAYIHSLEEQRDQYDKNSDAYKEADAKVQAAKNAQAEKEFNAKKASAIAEAVINGAVAVAEAYPNLLLAGVIAGLTGTQVAAIGAQQYVPFASGGYVDQPTHALVGEAGGEWILNKAQMAGLAKNGIGGGGVTIVQNIGGSIWNTKQLQGMATAAVSKASRGF